MTDRFDNELDELFTKLEQKNLASTIGKGAVGVALAVFLAAVALTVAGIVLSITVSPWFLIAVLVTGFYATVSGISVGTVLYVSRKLK